MNHLREADKAAQKEVDENGEEKAKRSIDRPHVFDDAYVNEEYAIRPDCVEGDPLMFRELL